MGSAVAAFPKTLPAVLFLRDSGSSLDHAAVLTQDLAPPDLAAVPEVLLADHVAAHVVELAPGVRAGNVVFAALVRAVDTAVSAEQLVAGEDVKTEAALEEAALVPQSLPLVTDTTVTV